MSPPDPRGDVAAGGVAAPGRNVVVARASAEDRTAAEIEIRLIASPVTSDPRWWWCVAADDPANTRRPSASFTTRALAMFDPSLAREPSTVTSSPTFSEWRAQPLRTRTVRAWQLEVPVVNLALSRPSRHVEPRVRIHPLDFATVPFSVIGLFASVLSANE